MIRIKNNRLLLQVTAVYALYCIVGYIIPKPYAASAVSILALFSGAFMFLRFAPKAFDVLFRQERGEYGAHSSILGATEMSLGLVYTGLFRLLLIYFDHTQAGQASTWTGTVASSLGIFMIAKGMARMATSADDLDELHHFYNRYWLIILWLFSLVIVFIAGVHFSSFG